MNVRTSIDNVNKDLIFVTVRAQRVKRVMLWRSLSVKANTVLKLKIFSNAKCSWDTNRMTFSDFLKRRKYQC